MEKGGQTLSILNITHNSKKVQVYNLTVANGHTYYVSTDEVLVHNAGVCKIISGFDKQHIFRGVVNGRGKATGFHHRIGGANPGGARLYGKASAVDKNGVYSARVLIKILEMGNGY